MKRTIKFLTCTILLTLISNFSVEAQNTIEPKKGYTPHIGVTISMLEDLKSRVTYTVENLSQEETDFLLDEDANRVGALILHLAATEKYYQVFTIENRGFTKEEKEEWDIAQNLGDLARESLVGKPIDYYLDIWTKVRKETLRLLKDKDDEWFASEVEGVGMNNHWAWYHVMEHQANHMGQIRLILKGLKNKTRMTSYTNQIIVCRCKMGNC